MNTTAFGDVLEKQVHDYLFSLIQADRYWVKKEHCKFFWKKGYYSAHRKSKIVFDVSIEVWLPGAAQYSLLILVECKRYTNSKVPVGDIEEFFQKVQQVSSGNRKAIVVSNAAFESGTRNFAQSNGIALVRFFGPDEVKWELQRPVSLGPFDAAVDDRLVRQALAEQEFVPLATDLYAQAGHWWTTCFWDLTEVLVQTSDLEPEMISSIENTRAKPTNIVPFVDDAALEEKARLVLDDIGYQSGEVSLEMICALGVASSGLTVERIVQPRLGPGSAALGRISFSPPVIHIYEQELNISGRDRFTLAHELGHFFLGHSKFLKSEHCSDDDFSLAPERALLSPEVARLEYQANVFASCLLMPRQAFVGDVQRIATMLDIRDRGFGLIYLDHQDCNRQDFYRLTGALMERYAVSRAAAAIRLETLGLLRHPSNQHGSV